MKRHFTIVFVCFTASLLLVPPTFAGNSKKQVASQSSSQPVPPPAPAIPFSFGHNMERRRNPCHYCRRGRAQHGERNR